MANVRDADRFRDQGPTLDRVGAEAFRFGPDGRPQIRVNGQWLYSDTTVTKAGSPAVLANPTPNKVASDAPAPSVVQLGTPLGDVLAGG